MWNQTQRACSNAGICGDADVGSGGGGGGSDIKGKHGISIKKFKRWAYNPGACLKVLNLRIEISYTVQVLQTIHVQEIVN